MKKIKTAKGMIRTSVICGGNIKWYDMHLIRIPEERCGEGKKKKLKEIRSEKKMKSINHVSKVLRESTHRNSMPEQMIIKLVTTKIKKII